MRYLVWALRLVVFIVVLLFALKNTGPVDVNFYADHVVTGVPLIVVMLVAFVVGVLFALLAIVPAMLRRRREIKRLEREVSRLQAAAAPEVAHAPVSPDAVAPLSPL
ncbi:LapA family protein [Pusillimonas minor]|uniref:LapA family protein n=1 Tax=Pusillimonas minor TaxID=2697024 RepID=A0A842HJM4_9BURK|nr:LapA family protein [Pusillimonas minor]MBC2768423.1 LapA family protein [Pusillimonas minor]